MLTAHFTEEMGHLIRNYDSKKINTCYCVTTTAKKLKICNSSKYLRNETVKFAQFHFNRLKIVWGVEKKSKQSWQSTTTDILGHELKNFDARS